MTTSYDSIFAGNRTWVAAQTAQDPDYFERLSRQHTPHTLYIGCSDARVPVDALTQTGPGELFVHRNVANLVVPTCANLLAVLQYAVQALKVRDVVVCGHYGCGGVKAGMSDDAAPTLVEGWISNIRTVGRLHADELAAIADEGARYRRLVELSAIEQVRNLSRTVPVREAWAAGAELRLHGIVYDIHDGLLRDLGVTMDAPAGAAAVTERAAAVVLDEDADAPAVAPGARPTRGGGSGGGSSNGGERVSSRA